MPHPSRFAWAAALAVATAVPSVAAAAQSRAYIVTTDYSTG